MHYKVYDIQPIEPSGGVGESKEEEKMTLSQLETNKKIIEDALVANNISLRRLNSEKLVKETEIKSLEDSGGDAKDIKERKATLKAINEQIKNFEDAQSQLNLGLEDLNKKISEASTKEMDKLIEKVPAIAKGEILDVAEEEEPVLEPIAPVKEFKPAPAPVAEVETSGGFVASKYSAKFKGINYPRLRGKFIQLSIPEVRQLAKNMNIGLSTTDYHTGLTPQQFNGKFFDENLNNKFKIKSGKYIFST